MKEHKTGKITPDVSPIIESYDKNGSGILGFTIKHQDGSFENVMQSFTVRNRDLVLAELEIQRDLALKQINSF